MFAHLSTAILLLALWLLFTGIRQLGLFSLPAVVMGILAVVSAICFFTGK